MKPWNNPQVQISMMHEETIRWIVDTFGSNFQPWTSRVGKTMYKTYFGPTKLREHLPSIIPFLKTKPRQAILMTELLQLRNQSNPFRLGDPRRQNEICLQISQLNKGIIH